MFVSRDFLSCFTSLSICYQQPGPREQKKLTWREKVLHGSWTSSSGGSLLGGVTQFLANPQYLLTVCKTGLVSLALMQKGRRQMRTKERNQIELAIGLTLLRLTKY